MEEYSVLSQEYTFDLQLFPIPKLNLLYSLPYCGVEH